MYNQGADLWPGALTADGTANYVTPNPLGQTLWNVTRAEINQHISNYNQSGYVAPSSILNWPAHGDVSQNQSAQLAPFVDVNYNGVYEPNLGDHPCIKGDYAVYTIMNDMGNIHYSGGVPIGLEIHFMFYQFASNDALDNTTFIDVEIHNRGTQTLYDFATSFIMDGDIGGPSDDYVGCDTTRNLMFQYNADNFDDDMMGAPGYGSNPPSLGIMCLNDTISSFRGFSLLEPLASNPIEMYNLMLGLNLNGTPMLDGNTAETKFQYFDNPNNSGGWSEEAVVNIPGDRRSIVSVISPSLVPFSSMSYSYAVIYSRDGLDNLDNVNELLDVADQIQMYYDNNIDGECEFTLATNSLEAIEFDIYPNPNNGTFSINPHGALVNAIVVKDMAGREVYRESVNSSINLDVKLNCDSGLYIVSIETALGHFTKSIVLD